jgi:hypothetical protein
MPLARPRTTLSLRLKSGSTPRLVSSPFWLPAPRSTADCLWLVTTNDNLDALRFYQRRGFRITEVRLGAVDEARRTLKPGIPAIGASGIPIRDEIVLERP